MSDPLHDYLRFYRDLGFTEIRLPEGLNLGVQPGTSQTASPAAVSRSSPSSQSARPAPSATSSAAGRSTPAAASASEPPKPHAPAASPSDLFSPPSPAGSREDPLPVLQQIQTDIGDCTRCVLHKGRSKIVFGSGNPNAKLVFVGEGPGADEDAQGLPFVGRAGQLLTQMINNTASKEGIPITRDDVYICNVVKCRPPGNRTPEPDEMETCGQFLSRQLDAIRPKAICLLGGTAARYLLATRTGITKLRGNWQDWRGIPVMPTYHPSFLLRPYAGDKKREAWEDLKKALHFVYDTD